MNKSELIDELSARFDGNRRAAQHALEAVLDTVTRSVAKGEAVAITGFGKFEKRVRPAGTARNPQTGARVRTKKRSFPKFTPGAEFKAVVNGEKKLAAAAKTTVKKATSTARSAATKAAPARKAPAKKAPAKRTVAKKAPAKKAPAKRTVAKKAPAKKAPAKRATAKKAPAKRTAAKRA